MKNSKPLTLLSLALLVFVLSACSGFSAGQPVSAAPAVQEESSIVEEPPAEDPAPTSNGGGTTIWTDGQARVDEQGAVIVEATPLNLNDPGETIVFEVALNTHSVDLSMDLAALAILDTDTGISIAASSWDGPAGGHHVGGTLSFPATWDGSPVLEGASRVTLTLFNVDAAQRVFEWNR